MGLEAIGDTSTPANLNEDWPLDSDNPAEGDDHIRNIKNTMKTFYGEYTSYKTTINARWEGEKARTAKVADKLGDKDLAYILDLANATGTAPGATLPQASTTDAGVAQLSSSLTDTSEDKAATPKALNELRKVIDGAAVVSNAISWKKVAVSAGARQLALTNDLIAELGKANGAVEIAVVVRANTSQGRFYQSYVFQVDNTTYNRGGIMVSPIVPLPNNNLGPVWRLHLQNTGATSNRFDLEAVHKVANVTSNYVIETFNWRVVSFKSS